MLNNKKIRLMTKLSLYERKNESRELKAGKYYKSDYVSLGLLNSAIVATFAFFIVIALVILVNIEELLAVITTLDFLEIGKVLVSSYLIYLIVYLFIVNIVYRMRYEKMSKGIKEYDAMLKELYLIYKKEANMVQETLTYEDESEASDEVKSAEEDEESEENEEDESEIEIVLHGDDEGDYDEDELLDKEDKEIADDESDIELDIEVNEESDDESDIELDIEVNEESDDESDIELDIEVDIEPDEDLDKESNDESDHRTAISKKEKISDDDKVLDELLATLAELDVENSDLEEE